MSSLLKSTEIFLYSIESNDTYDLIIVGAGPVGCVVAERAATLYNWRSLIIDKRSHIAGNCYDSTRKSGLMVHNYGPHYFRTNSSEIIDYLSEFTSWIEGDYIVKSKIGDELFPFPINLETLEQFFGLSNLNSESAQELLDSKREEILEPINSEEFVLSRVGKELYEAFYLGYTQKMWDKHPSELDPSVCGRIPIKLNRDPFYVEHKYKKLPEKGYTEMFRRMTDHPLIDFKLGTDYFDIKDDLKASKATIYTGPIDRYFDFIYGKLEWRSLDFQFEELNQEFAQECVQVNYPGDEAFTRKVEIKHITKQKHNKTVVCTEFPKSQGEPYYPVPNKENQERYRKYKELSTFEKDTFFVGRLAEYTYINTDEAIAKGLKAVSKLA
ncbi:MAG: UDP-galactopyranose mutase [Bacteroidia bacterium]